MYARHRPLDIINTNRTRMRFNLSIIISSLVIASFIMVFLDGASVEKLLRGGSLASETETIIQKPPNPNTENQISNESPKKEPTPTEKEVIKENSDKLIDQSHDSQTKESTPNPVPSPIAANPSTPILAPSPTPANPPSTPNLVPSPVPTDSTTPSSETTPSPIPSVIPSTTPVGQSNDWGPISTEGPLFHEFDGVKFMVITYLNTKIDPICDFVQSIQLYGVRFNMVGWGNKINWREYHLGSKIVQSIKFLERFDQYIPDDTIIMFSDSLDVLVQQNPRYIVQNFLSFNKRLVFSTEKDCWPPIFAPRYPKVPGVYNHLNSGGYIGYKAEIKAILNFAAEDRNEPEHFVYRNPTTGAIISGPMNDEQAAVPPVLKRNDQIIFAELYLENKGITLDSNTQLFQSMQLNQDDKKKHVEIYEGRLRNKMSSNIPALVHFNGGSKNAGGYMARVDVANAMKNVYREHSSEIYPLDQVLRVFSFDAFERTTMDPC